MKNVIITGANSGLGFETAKKIAAFSEDFRLILACRNKEKGEEAKKEIIEKTENQNVTVMELDTASLSSVRNFCEEWKKRDFGNIYALLCNAGISGSSTGLTEDGFDLVFQTNHLGHFLLTNLLLPYIQEDGLIFSTSSDMHDSPIKKMSWSGTEILAHPSSSFGKDSVRYSYSKLCNLYFVYELAEKLNAEGKKIRVNAFNPGLMKTNFMPLTKASIAFVTLAMPDRFGDLEKSSDAYASLVCNETLVPKSGLYYDRSINEKKSSPLSYNVENRKELWQKSAEYCGL